MSNFSIFFPLGQKNYIRVGSKSTRVKGGSASYLLWIKSVLGSGQGPISRWIWYFRQLRNLQANLQKSVKDAWIFFYLFKYALKFFSLTAHFLAGTYLWFFATLGQSLPGAIRVRNLDPQIPSVMPRPLSHSDP